MQTLDLGAETLPEATIRAIAYDGGNLVPKTAVEVDFEPAHAKLQGLTAVLLRTVNHPDISGGHRTAACNLLCTVISQCSQSSIGRFRAVIWDGQTWVDAFQVFLTQNSALSVKPLRQLLTSLTTALDKCQDSSISASIRNATLSKLVGILCSTNEHVPIRPAMQALAHFLAKKIVSADDVYETICNVRGHAADGDDGITKCRTIMDVILQWAPYDDYSSAAGLLASTILECISKREEDLGICKVASVTFNSKHEVSWANPVLTVLARNPSRLDNYRHYVFPELFKHSLKDLVVFLEQLGLHGVLGQASEDTPNKIGMLARDQAENLLFCALSVGSKLGSVRIAEAHKRPLEKLFFAQDALCIPDSLLGSLLLRSSSTVRIAALSMLISSSATTKPMSLGTFRALRRGLPHSHAEPDAGFRSELFSLIRNLVDRLRAACTHLAKISVGHSTVRRDKETANMDISPEVAALLLNAHYEFLDWYLSFLRMELRPNASYQRHISAVKSIEFIYRSGVDSRVPIEQRAKSTGPKREWPFQIDVVDDVTTDLLLDLLLNPYDDVREGAAKILTIAPGHTSHDEAHEHGDAHRLVNVLHKAERMMMTSGRADQADGVARLYAILYNRCAEQGAPQAHWWMSKLGVLEHLVETLESTLAIAAEDMSKAVSSHPLHGIFISLRYILESPAFYRPVSSTVNKTLRAIHSRLYESFKRVWSCVKPTLCQDAPEGSAEEVDEEANTGTNDILSYSWRALKEASLLIGIIVKSCPLGDSDDAIMKTEDLRSMGDLSFTQLAELRHRGAFSTVAQTFAIFCVRCNSGSEITKGYLQVWYQRAILCIQNQTTINTRRSAGIPSLINGLVIADENKGVFFNKAVRDLTAEATKPVNAVMESAGGLSQVHALNSLKEIFKNSKLGDRSEPHVPEALGLAADCLSSDTWAVRNSGLMLFRALLDRLLGTNDSYVDQMTAPQSRLSFTAIPSLMDVIIRLISPPLDTTKDLLTEGVFPALQLLQRTPPPADKVQDVRTAVLRLTASSQWHIRDKAAQTYAVLLAPHERLSQAESLITETKGDANTIHGALLTARYITQLGWSIFKGDGAGQRSSIFAGLSGIEAALHLAADSLYHSSKCPFTKAAFIDLYSDWCHAACLAAYQPADIEHRSTLSAPSELDDLLDLDHEAFTATSALRQSLAHAILQEAAYLESLDQANPESLIKLVDLAHAGDPDACTSMLVEAARLCTGSERFRNLTAQLLTWLSINFLFENVQTVDLEVQAAAQDVLLALLDSEQSETVEELLREEAMILHLSTNAATPLFQHKRMVLQGALLDLRFSGEELSGRSLPDDFVAWVESIRSALHEENPFDTRLAAAHAVGRINQGLATIAKTPDYADAFLKFAICVYDLTNDDDDDVRNIAATCACSIISALDGDVQVDLLPMPAGSRLVGVITQRSSRSPSLAVAAMTRLSGAIETSSIRSVQDSLVLSGRQDSALFIQEKQNLFIDEAREARLWSHVLMRMSKEAVSQQSMRTLEQWTIEGLHSLALSLDAGADGPLGWKRRPEVFVLGLRVIYAAEVLLMLRGKDAVISTSELRAELVKLLVEGKAKDLHPLLVEQIERVLVRAILRGAARVGRVVSQAAARLEG